MPEQEKSGLNNTTGTEETRLEILYQFHFSWGNLPSIIILLFMGIILLFYKITIFPKSEIHQKDNIWYSILFIFLKVAGIFCILITIHATVLNIKDYSEKRNALANNQVYVIEGYTENYHPRPFGGHDKERFEINGVRFEYPKSATINGYDIPACYGGVITENGQHLLIKYVTESDGSNTILFIQRLE